MLWKLSVAVAVVCVGGLCSSVRADLMSRLIMPRDYGVKLCGREFIRAVIFTCGGSRWRRSTQGELDPFQSSPLGDVTAEENLHAWPRGAELSDGRLPRHAPSSFSLADLLSFHGAFRDLQQTLDGAASPEEPQQRSPALGGEDADPAADNWTVPTKKKRNFSLGMAGMCCAQGCTKHDIGRLC